MRAGGAGEETNRSGGSCVGHHLVRPIGAGGAIAGSTNRHVTTGSWTAITDVVRSNDTISIRAVVWSGGPALASWSPAWPEA